MRRLAIALVGSLLPTEAPAAFSLDHCDGGTVPAYKATTHNCQMRCSTDVLHMQSARNFDPSSVSPPGGCARHGFCENINGTIVGKQAYGGATAWGVYPDGMTKEVCDNTTIFPGGGWEWKHFKFVNSANDDTVYAQYKYADYESAGNTGYAQKSAPPSWTKDESGGTCVALEGKPEQPTYKLPMCKMYNEKSCCAPIHDAETQWAYETLVDVADRCLQYVNEEHFALREFFCIVCDSDQSRYTSMVEDMGAAETDSNLKGILNTDVAGEIRVCKSFADRVWFHAGDDYDRCGFIIYTDGEDLGDADNLGELTKIVPFGDVNPATGDDPILPSKYWTYDPAKGTAIEQFFNTIKPGMLDKFQFRVIDDVNTPALKETCFHGSGGAFVVVPSVVLSLGVLFSATFL